MDVTVTMKADEYEALRRLATVAARGTDGLPKSVPASVIERIEYIKELAGVSGWAR